MTPRKGSIQIKLLRKLLAGAPNPSVPIAGNKSTKPEVLAYLALDPDRWIQDAVFKNPHTEERMKAGILHMVSIGKWVREPEVAVV